jgi:hypothetical protein
VVPAQAAVFISHSDSAAALELDHLIESGFEGRLRTFNTSRHDRGLSAGDLIDGHLLDELRNCSVFVSLWTPSAVLEPAWMAWELGAAAAVSTATVLTARARGAAVEDLPLNLTARYSPDLGDVDHVLELFTSIARHTDQGFQPSTVRSEFERLAPEPSGLEACMVEEAIVVTIHGRRRGLLENLTKRQLSAVTARAGTEDDVTAVAVASAVERALNHRRKRAAPRIIEPNGRLVFNLPEGADLHGSATVRFSWLAENDGREQQDIVIDIPDEPGI